MPLEQTIRSLLDATLATAGGLDEAALSYLQKRSQDGEFSTADEHLIRALATQVAEAAERRRAEEREHETIRRLRALLAANLALTDVLDQDAVLQTIVDLARDLADAEYAALGVLAADGTSLAAFIHSGMDPAVVERIGPLPQGRGLLGTLLLSDHPVRLHRMQRHPASVGFPAHHPPMESFLGVALSHRGQVFGNLYLTNKRGGDFTEMDEEIVASLAAQAAIAIQNAKIVTRERDLIEQLREIDEMKTEFISMVSHELRTPLVALRAGAELLELSNEELPLEDRKDVEAAIRRQADRLYQLIANLLDFSRIEQGRLAMTVGPVPVHQAVADVVATTPPLLGVQIDVEVEPETTVIADPLYLRQILTNLLVNAVTYGAEPIVVTATSREDGNCEIRVRDAGPGIAPDLVPRLFEKFTRGNHAAAIPGSGLGLALSAALTTEFGGSIHHEHPLGGGTTFVVTLPIPTGASA